jgi:predicted esterase YcpF (UPF0227 family)
VLLNPAVDPARDLASTSASRPPGTTRRALLLRAGIRRRTALAPRTRGPVAHPENYLAVIAKGDEVLDWREMTGRYPGARTKLLEGSDHAI